MYRKILYIPQPCTRKIKERERDTEGGGGEERGGSEGGRGGREVGREVGREGGERKRKLIFFFFVQMNGKPRQKRLLPLFFFKK